MENQNLDKLNLLDKIINISKKKSKLLLSILFIAFVVICVAIFLDYLKTNKNNKKKYDRVLKSLLKGCKLLEKNNCNFIVIP